jgi:phosphoribosylglycinamide formyltransferase-1
MIDAVHAGELDADIRVVISNRADAYGLERAAKAGIAAVHVDPGAFADATAYNEAIRDVLLDHNVEAVAMAGYMKLLGGVVLEAFPGRVLNIHPALLPSFAGAHGIEDAFDYGVKVTGVTVHFADEEFDAGPIIAQEAVPINEHDTLDTLEEKMHAVEHSLYPRALQLLAEDRLRVEGRRVRIVPVGED